MFFFLIIFNAFNTQLVDAGRSLTARPLFSVPCSPVSPQALSSTPLSSRKERKTSKRPHVAGDIWAFFCLCLLYIPVTLGTAGRPPFPRRCSTLPPCLNPTSVEHSGVICTTSCQDCHNKSTSNSV